MDKPLVLVIDDSRAFLDLVTGVLADHGCDVITAVDGITGLNLARQRRPSVVVTDAQMPGISGFLLCLLLRGEPEFRNLPVYMVSTFATPLDRYWSTVCGATGHFDKTVPVDETAAKIATRAMENTTVGASLPPLTAQQVFQHLTGVLQDKLLVRSVEGDLKLLAYDSGDPNQFAESVIRSVSSFVAMRSAAVAIAIDGQVFAACCGSDGAAIDEMHQQIHGLAFASGHEDLAIRTVESVAVHRIDADDGSTIEKFARREDNVEIVVLIRPADVQSRKVLDRTVGPALERELCRSAHLLTGSACVGAS